MLIPLPDPQMLIKRYVAMIERLQKTTTEFSQKTEDSQHQACFCALSALMDFLIADPRVVHLGLAAPFGALIAAMNDVRRGGKPALFAAPSARPTGRPASLSKDAGRALVTLVVDLLVKTGMRAEDASKEVARELSKPQYQRVGQPLINKKTILRWFREKGAASGIPSFSTRGTAIGTSVRQMEVHPLLPRMQKPQGSGGGQV
jgi:hypothetical protein